ncbi:MAG: alpha-L-fucosidase [Clostridia bacterium]|nr:alpha-L-fucosidase [Clostridia bacterium]
MKKIITEGWCVSNNNMPIGTEETERYVSVLPSQRQLEFMELEYYNFIHFGVNTMNNREWGDGNEDISHFNPEKLDTDQWCRVLKSTGSKGIIITAKHHDGFCLFDTKYTDHNVMNTPFGKDIVKMLSESCRRHGLKLGIYLSPWDRHEKTYGTEEYNDFFVNQLTELCLNYGDIFCFWFDGACGEGKSGKKQVYDWDRYYSVIRKHHPDAVISVCGPDVRWIGNEGGKVRKSEWSVIPDEKNSNDAVAESSQTDEAQTKQMAERLTDYSEDLGSRDVLKNYGKLIFKPAEADVSINTGWFWHNNLYYLFKKQRTAEDLAKIYFDSVGGNASMLLNVPPDKDGLINKREIKTLKKFTELITKPFEKEISDIAFYAYSPTGEDRVITDATVTLGKGETGVRLSFKDNKSITLLSFREDLTYSQRIEEFRIFAKKASGEYSNIYTGTVVGSRKIVRLENPVNTDEILIIITQARANPVIKDIRIYG